MVYQTPADYVTSTGARSIRTLTPTQLERKRAYDREAQRAKRARTKEYIKSLKNEIHWLRCEHSRNHLAQNLRRRNKVIEYKISRLLGSMGLSSVETSARNLPLSDDPRKFNTEGSCVAVSPACLPVMDDSDATIIYAPGQVWQQNSWQYGGPYYSTVSVLRDNFSIFVTFVVCLTSFAAICLVAGKSGQRKPWGVLALYNSPHQSDLCRCWLPRRLKHT